MGQYLLVTPSVLQSDSPNTVCVHLLNLNESVNLNVVLEYEGRNITVLMESVRSQSYYKCTNVTVPPPTANPLAFLTISFKGDTIHLSERRVVAIQNIGSVAFVQTDKPIYKPGQTVLFRVVALDTHFRPVVETFPLITVQDPQKNRIFQWRDVTSTNGIIQLSFPLNSEPMLGDYKITVEKKSGAKTSHYFSVEEYVLPKFDVTVTAPKSVSVENPDFLLKVCSVYTYGQPVEGKVQLSVCRNLNFYGSCQREPVCEVVNRDLGKGGCLSHVFSSKKFELNRSGYWMNLDVKAIVTEKGTGIRIERSAYISITRVLGAVQFENMDQHYKRGIPYCGQLKLVGVDDAPIANEVVQLLLKNKNVGNYTTNGNGTAQFCIDTSEILSPDFPLRLIYKPNENCNSDGWLLPYYPEASYTVQRFYSRTNSFVKIHQVFEDLPCGQVRRIRVSYILNVQESKSRPTAVFYYAVLVRNKIVHYGQFNVGSSHGSFFIPLNVGPHLAPVATLLVYTLHPDREVVADTARFQIEKCFRNKVRLQFSAKQALPASNVSLHISAAANSHCALRAVDQSVLLLRPERELSAESVYSLLPYRMFGYYFEGLNLDDNPQEPCISPENIFYNGLYYVPSSSHNGLDIYESIKVTGIKFITNSRLRQPVICGHRSGGILDTVRRTSVEGEDSRDKAMIATVRKFFPETWIWDLVPTDATGKAQLSYIVPDTITEWKTNAFCVHGEAGFGLSESASLTAFQSFFVELTMPYSIVRGEDFLLKANVFNYLGTCIQVRVFLAQSQDFQAQLLSPVNDNGCVCGGKRKTYIWKIVTKKLGDVKFSVTAEAPQNGGACRNGSSGGLDVGRKDTLIRTLLVEPEGVEREATQSSLICTKDAAVSEQVSLKLPANLVEGSARAFFSCIGDLMGTAMQNLHQLLQMPYGCGEQNVALLATDIYILEYLNATAQLTEETKSKVIGYIVSGYQRQLLYKHHDGSYSAFGHRGKESNIWLTAFVYRTLARASAHIFIDQNVQRQTFTWLASKQRSDGCFQNVGENFNNALQGAGNELARSAYITIALLESSPLLRTNVNSDPVIRNALFCLEAGLEKGNISVYDQALLAYAFSLAGNKPKLDLLLDMLYKSAKKEGGTLHWERDDKPPAERSPSFFPRAQSAEVEMTSYVLSALITKPNLTPEEMTTASQIVQWVAKQQNPYGGFSSTQDTVTAIQALAKYSQLTFSKDGRNTVKMHSSKPFEKVFMVDHSNRLLLQQTPLPDVPGDYTVNVKGSGCVFVQTTLKYNIILPHKASGFSLSVQTANASCEGSVQTKFTIVIAASYTGKRNHSNMAIVDVKMLTGFVPDPSSLRKLRDSNIVMKVETKENHVLCYLDNLSPKETIFSFIVVQDLPVSNLRAAPVRVYDYYETDENSVAEYKFPCSTGGS
ncbi:ovostatin-like [Tiliqua scincoides]|uniref:ovostatin-like n=1 Tax=Tiliqua scincoides TaxID=71010 RepID=UPI003461BA5E